MDTKQIDAIVTKALKQVGAPGAALVVVTPEGSYCKGYGVKKKGGDEPVTPETLFPIASVSKAFTATACAILADDGKLGFDDLVRKHLPGFRLLDSAADANVTVRDLLCHRTGLPRHDALWYRTTLGRAELLRRMASLKPTASYRGLYQYNNLCFLAAGEVVAAASGMPFEEFLRQRLLEPLGMHTVTFSGPGLVTAENHAWPHQKKKGKVVALDAPLDFSNVGPAGCINACVAELAHWLRFQLSGGGDGTPVSQKSLAETHAPQTIVPADDLTRELYPDRMHHTYALGWGRHDWAGHLVLTHSGAIDGFRSQAVLCPREGIAFAVLVNLPGYLGEIVRNSLLDHLLGVTEGRDWHKVFGDLAKKDAAKAVKSKKEKAEKRHKGTKPSLALKSYVGEYTDPGYGTVTVGLHKGKLQLTWEAFSSPLKHWHFDTFVTETEQPGFSELEVSFSLKPDGTIATLTLWNQDFLKG